MKIRNILLSSLLSLSLVGQACLPVFAQEENNQSEEVEEISNEESVEEVTEPEIVMEEKEDAEEIETEAENNYMGFSYIYCSDGIHITGYTSSSAEVNIPDEINGTLVVGIDPYAFKNKTYITSVTIPTTIGYIGKEAFSGLVNLKTIYYNAIDCQDCTPNSNCFYNAGINNGACEFICGEYVERIPANLCGQYDSTNKKTNAINWITLGNNVLEIGKEAFAHANISDLVLPYSLLYIGEHAFAGCYNLKNIFTYMDEGQCDFGVFENAGYNTDGITIQFSECVKTIPKNFLAPAYGRTGPNIKELTVPATVQYIEEYSFANLDTLQSITFLGAPTTVSDLAFSGTDIDIYYSSRLAKEFNIGVTCKIYQNAVIRYHKSEEKNGLEIDPTISAIYQSPNYPNDYPNNMTLKTTEKSYTFKGASYLEITFVDDCYLENNYDYVCISDGNDNNVISLTGQEMAGQTYTIEGDYVSIWLESDNGICYKGVKATITPYTLDKKPESYVKGYNLTLSGDIQLNYYVDTHKVNNIATNVHARIYTEGINARQDNIPLNQLKTKSTKNGTYYIFSYGVSAKDMAQPIHFLLYYGNELLEEKVYSVNDYAKYIIEHPSNYSGDDVYVAKKMLTYGKYAQDYFGVYPDKGVSYLTNIGNYDFSNYSMQIVDNNPNIDYVGARLVLADKIGIELYFKGEATLTCNGKALGNHKDGNYTVYEINDVTSYSTLYTITAPGNSLTLRYSLRSYFYSAMQTNNLPLKNLCNALYEYLGSINAAG